jgi:hypothetical protein
VPVVPAERPAAIGDEVAPLAGAGAETGKVEGAKADAAASGRDKPGSGTLDFTHSSGPVSLPFGKPPRAVVAPAPQQAPTPQQTPTSQLRDQTMVLPGSAPAAGPAVPAQVVGIPVLAPAAPAAPVAAPAPPVDVPVAYTGDVAKPADLRGAAAEAQPEKKTPEEEVDIERHGMLSAALDEPKAKLGDVLEANRIEFSVWKAADRHWRRAMDHEVRRGQRGLRERFDSAYVAEWEKAHPGRFVLGHYARLAHAEQQGLLSVELSEQGLSPNLGMRLRRVFRARISQTPTLREQLDRELAILRADT